jgi:hypothetical protein
LSKRYIVLSLLLVVTLIAGLTAAQGQANDTSSIMGNNTTQMSAEKLAASTGNNSANSNATAVNASTSAEAKNTSETAKAASEIAKMKGIWSISGIEKEQIAMALKQDGADIFGVAKYEPESEEAWNAVAIGSFSNDNVELVVTSLKGNEQVSTWLNGTYADEAFSGKFFEVSKGNISRRGEFSATLVNTEISEYTPAKVIAPTSAQPKTQEATQSAVSSATTPAQAGNQSSAQQAVTVSGRKKPVDVHEYADKIGVGGDLSGVPPGMGGSL